MTYLCGKCSKSFEGQPFGAGAADIHPERYKDGDPVPDVLICVCEDCTKEIRERQGRPWPS